MSSEGSDTSDNLDGSNPSSSSTPGDTDPPSVTDLENVLQESENFFADYEMDEVASKRKRKSTVQVTRQYWSKEEESEIRTLFKDFFDNHKRPKPNEIKQMMLESESRGGVICNRTKDTLKKKVFRMIDKAAVE